MTGKDKTVGGMEVWQRAMGAFHAEPEGSLGYASDVVQVALDGAHSRGIREGLERAAEIVERGKQANDHRKNCPCSTCCSNRGRTHTAAAIRAEASKLEGR